MRLAELHNPTGWDTSCALDDFHARNPVSASSPRKQGGKDVGLPKTGMYVSVWQVLPVQHPDPALENPGVFVGYGLIDSVADGGDSTNITILPLSESDSYYPFYPGTVKRRVEKSGYPVGAEAKCCRGYRRSESYSRAPIGSRSIYYPARCDSPITRITQHYGDMTCDACYPAAQREDNESLAAEKEMHDIANNPAKYLD